MPLGCLCGLPVTSEVPQRQEGCMEEDAFQPECDEDSVVLAE